MFGISRKVIGSRFLESVRGSSHKGWVKEYLGNLEKAREEKWTDSITVVTRPFVQNIHALLGFRAKGKDVIEGAEGYHLRINSDFKNSVPTRKFQKRLTLFCKLFIS